MAFKDASQVNTLSHNTKGLWKRPIAVITILNKECEPSNLRTVVYFFGIPVYCRFKYW